MQGPNSFNCVSFQWHSPLYDEVISLCIDLGEVDAAIADMKTTGIKLPDETLDKVLASRQVVIH